MRIIFSSSCDSFLPVPEPPHYIVEDFRMRISYKKLWILLAEKEMTKQKFREELQIAAGTMTKLNKGQEVSMSVILRICEYFGCNIGDICDAVKIE